MTSPPGGVDNGVAPGEASNTVGCHGATPADSVVADSVVGDVDGAASAAVARARAAAKAKGLRPGQRRARKSRGASPTFSGSARDGRDPTLIGEQLDRLLLERGWQLDVSAGAVMGRWPQIVGPEVGEHTEPVTFTDGVLTIRADSTAWATQLRLMSSLLLARIADEVGADVVADLRVVGPSAPSWVRGPRRAQGPGPRDTYG